MLVGRCSSELSGHQPEEIKKVTGSDRSEPGFPATLHSPTPAGAAFSEESRMKLTKATNLDRKSGGGGAVESLP
jgi:hypothetical protein